jgi:hypothetical protein
MAHYSLIAAANMATLTTQRLNEGSRAQARRLPQVRLLPRSSAQFRTATITRVTALYRSERKLLYPCKRSPVNRIRPINNGDKYCRGAYWNDWYPLKLAPAVGGPARRWSRSTKSTPSHCWPGLTAKMPVETRAMSADPLLCSAKRAGQASVLFVGANLARSPIGEVESAEETQTPS